MSDFYVESPFEDEESKFVILPVSLFDKFLFELNHRDFVVFSYLTRLFYRFDGGERNPTIETIINGTNLTGEQVTKSLNSLMKKGLVIIIRNWTKITYKIRTKKDPVGYDNSGRLITEYWE